jgi:hypothetical protein
VISLNVLGHTPLDADGLLAWVRAAQPPYTLVMDDVALAQRVADAGTTVIFRRYRPDDAELASKLGPTAFLDSVADVPAGWIVQAGNEPGGDQAQLVQWTVALMHLATARGRRLAIGSWSVGNPDDLAVAAGAYDPLLRALAGSGHVLSLHEYFLDDPATEPWHIGRYRAFLRRAEALGLARPVIVITEHGRDLGGGHDGWRVMGWSEADYARRLEAAQRAYNADGITACVFCYGRGFDDRWQTFNVDGAGELLARMAAMNRPYEYQEDEDMLPPGWAKLTITSGASAVNVRALPTLSGAVIAAARTGDLVRLDGTVIVANGHRWQPIRLHDCTRAFVSLNVVRID